jgi:predicted metal-dependent phosphoesterase TrpH
LINSYDEKRIAIPQSLHTHTVDSDVEATHQQVLEAAEANGFGTVAFTDLDTVAKHARSLQETQDETQANLIDLEQSILHKAFEGELT